MEILSPDQLAISKCTPCEGGAKPYSPLEAAGQVAKLSGWQLVGDGQRIRKEWVAKDFMAAMTFLNHITTLAEIDGHHPDLHLEGYRNVAVELWTHAIGGLSENDFILAAKIDRLPVALLD